jgi:hypothetical protein
MPVYTEGMYAPTPLPRESAASRKRLREKFEAIDYENAKAKALGIVNEWMLGQNSVARALVRMAMCVPTSFTSVKHYECKLHNTLSCGLWVNEHEKTAHPLTKNDISRTVAMVASIVGNKKRRTLKGIESVSKAVEHDKNTNEMHALMRGMGFENFELPGLKERYAFMQNLKKTYAFKPEFSMEVSQKTCRMDEWWNDAVQAAIGPRPSSS